MISTHILDTGAGVAADNVAVRLEIQKGQEWQSIQEAKTNADGRISFSCPPVAGVYRLTFSIEEYFARHQRESFFQDMPVVFKITDTNRKYHVPLLVNSFGLSTYRGT